MWLVTRPETRRYDLKIGDVVKMGRVKVLVKDMEPKHPNYADSLNCTNKEQRDNNDNSLLDCNQSNKGCETISEYIENYGLNKVDAKNYDFISSPDYAEK